ncbi:MFS transporter [Nocardioides jiangxiensis]|uniref:MFS transporter n=1 Tax=Nocardioides jiangxiensis TaxID=3064524 RepID=A0ABT9B1A4_9ACTN|nr:MFS transporter [Nocardioides sp. WY-20]MDO7868094.1 MFS transporter [Nocardioides sp. WY-20]
MSRDRHLGTATIDIMGTGMAAYRRLLAHPTVRSVLVLGFMIRVPVFASFIVLTLHVVTGLDRSYSAAGLLETVTTVAMAVAAPWRGRALDRIGLRATVGPMLVVLVVVWSIAPFVPYAALLVLAAVGGLANVPHYSVMRQALISAVPDADRKAVLSLDALGTELSFMVGPVLGVVAATRLETSWALLGTQLVALAGGVGLWLANPPLVREETAAVATDGEPATGAGAVAARDRAPAGSTSDVPPGPLWRNPTVLAVLFAGTATTIVLTGTDLGVVAALRHMDQPGSIGWVLAIWGAGSALGVLVYGALHRPVPLNVLLALLAATTIPVALADDRLSLVLLLFVCGLFCAPTITAASEALSRAVPEGSLGEAMGWQGVAFTIGGATGAPLAGLVIDHGGWQGSFVAGGVVALLAAGAALALEAGRTRARVQVPRRAGA